MVIALGARVEQSFRRAIANVTRHGDTDIFPFPIENHVFFDQIEATISALGEIHRDFRSNLTEYPPSNISALAPVSYTGFRWATQIDPLWNLYFLAIVLEISDEIEKERVPTKSGVVHSYRISWNEDLSKIFDDRYSWRSFIEHSIEAAKKYKFVVICDISEFYSRIGHHRIENALAHLNLGSDIPDRIMRFLSNFSNTNSFGIPIGGPAARIISELTLNQVDQLLVLQGIEYCRYSDDFHLFANSEEEAFSNLLFLTEKLQRTQGLQLQKSKTRIMSSAEFVATSPIRADDHDVSEMDDDSNPHRGARNLLSLSLKFDPYSPTAEDDYEELRE